MKRAKAEALRLLMVGLVAGAVTLASSATVAADRLKVSAGVDYSSGDYGDPSGVDTEIWYYPLTVKYERFPWSLKATIPYLYLSNDLGNNSGIGDVVLSGSYGLEPSGPSMPYLEFTAKVKLPTADDDNLVGSPALGNGEVDYTLQVDFDWTLGKWVPLGTLGYKIKGDPNQDVVVAGEGVSGGKNVWFASGGVHYSFTRETGGGLVLDWLQASSDTSDDSVELMGYVSHRVTPDWNLNAYGVTGFTDGSPDYELGLVFTYRYDIQPITRY